MAPQADSEGEMRFNVAWMGGVAATLVTVVTAVGGILKAKKSDVKLTPVSHQWLAGQKREHHPD